MKRIQTSLRSPGSHARLVPARRQSAGHPQDWQGDQPGLVAARDGRRGGGVRYRCGGAPLLPSFTAAGFGLLRDSGPLSYDFP